MKLHGAFGAQERPTYAQGPLESTQPANPKQLVYEVFGPEGAVADISYFDANSRPQQVSGAALPWSMTMVSGSLVAQGDGDTIGCRIIVNGDVKAEKVSHEAHAFTNCLVKGA